MNTGKAIDIMRTLYHVGKLRMTSEGPELLGQNVMLIPRSLFPKLIGIYADNPELERGIYDMMHDTVYEFCASFDDKQDLSPAELLRILMRLTKLNGYGHIEINDYAIEDTTAAFYVRNLPSEDMEHERAFKGDTYWAGMLAGGMSYVFQQEVNALETQCVLEGAPSCRFIVAPKQQLQQEYPDLYREKFARKTEVTA